MFCRAFVLQVFSCGTFLCRSQDRNVYTGMRHHQVCDLCEICRALLVFVPSRRENMSGRGGCPGVWGEKAVVVRDTDSLRASCVCVGCGLKNGIVDRVHPKARRNLLPCIKTWCSVEITYRGLSYRHLGRAKTLDCCWLLTSNLKDFVWDCFNSVPCTLGARLDYGHRSKQGIFPGAVDGILWNGKNGCK